ncbi:iron transporter, partial [Streptomyces sp. NPDC127119]
PPDSWYGTLLKGILNFQPDPTILQVAVWVLYLIPVLVFFLSPGRSRSAPRSGKAAGQASENASEAAAADRP